MKKNLSIGIFVDTFFPMIDGVVVAVDNYATRLAEDNDVTVFAPHTKNNKNYQLDRPYKIVRCNTTKIPLIEYELSLPFIDYEFRRAIRKSKFDVIHIHSPFSIGRTGVKYAKKHKIPAFATFHSQYEQDFYVRTKNKTFTKIMMKSIMKVFNGCDLGFAVNNKLKEVYMRYGTTIETVVRNNGTDLTFCECPDKIKEFRVKYEIMPKEKILLFVGRIDKVKNIFFIAEVLRKLKVNDFKFKMLFIGKGFDEETLKEKIAKFGLSDNVLFLGKITSREEMALHYQLADLFIFPSLYDSSSLVQIEAASQKTPTLFIDGAVTADTITADFNGYLAKNDLDDYTEKLINIFSDDTKYKEVCKNAYETLFKTWDLVVQQTHDDYVYWVENNPKKK